MPAQLARRLRLESGRRSQTGLEVSTPSGCGAEWARARREEPASKRLETTSGVIQRENRTSSSSARQLDCSLLGHLPDRRRPGSRLRRPVLGVHAPPGKTQTPHELGALRALQQQYLQRPRSECLPPRRDAAPPSRGPRFEGSPRLGRSAGARVLRRILHSPGAGWFRRLDAVRPSPRCPSPSRGQPPASRVPVPPVRVPPRSPGHRGVEAFAWSVHRQPGICRRARAIARADRPADPAAVVAGAASDRARRSSAGPPRRRRRSALPARPGRERTPSSSCRCARLKIASSTMTLPLRQLHREPDRLSPLVSSPHHLPPPRLAL